MLNRIDRYVLKQIMVPLAASLGVGLSMLLAERMVRLLDTTLGKRNSFGAAFELLAYLVPHYLGIAIPAALFLGLLFGFNKLSKSNELDAMMATGVGMHQLVRSGVILAGVFSLLAIAIFGWLQPYTRYAYRATIFEITNVEAFYLAEEGVFMQTGTRTFILDQLNRKTSTFNRVFLFDDRGPKGTETLTARSGVLIPVEGETRPVLRLFDGHRLDLNTDVKPGAVAPPASVATYQSLDTPLGRVAQDVYRKRGADERELTLTDLAFWEGMLPQRATQNSMRAELHRRIIYILTTMLLPFLAIPFAVGRPRSPRAYRIAAALVLLIVMHEIIQQGALATENNGISPWITMWLPMTFLTIFALWRFHHMSFNVPGDTSDRIFEPVHDFMLAVTRKIWPRRNRMGAA
jgi:lipopolysaccharide export system permease protein